MTTMDMNFAPLIANRGEILARYQQIRKVTNALQDQLVRRLSQKTLDRGASDLGLFHNGRIVLKSEAQSPALLDHCLYDLYQGGLNAVEQFLVDCSPPADSDEMICLRAMQRARYSLFWVESVERGLGITVRDQVTQEMLFFVDLAFSTTAKPGLLYSARQLTCKDFSISTGATLPIANLPEDKLPNLRRLLLKNIKPDAEGRFDPTRLIREGLQTNGGKVVQYLDPGDQLPVGTINKSARAGRNDPCPCGSGKKFKQCCLNRD